MTLRHFQIFVAVCDQMNMTLAATHLYMSQSAVSQAIAELERHYELRLFERLSKKLYLTQGGQSLLGYARHILRLQLDAEEAMRHLSKGSKVRIGASVTIAATLLPALVCRIAKAQPQLPLDMVEENTAELEKWILHDQLDLAFVEGDIHASDLLCYPFAEDTLLLVCGPTHPLAGQAEVSTTQLMQENFILRELGSGTRQTFEDGMRRLALSWHSSWTCNNTESIKAALVAGLGISALSARSVAPELQNGTLSALHVPNLQFKRQFKLVYHKNKYITPAMQTVIGACFAENPSFPPPLFPHGGL